jgi:Protein of unknown function (DUF2442)
MAPRDEFDRANARAARQLTTHPTVVTARYDPDTDRVIMRLSNRLEVSFPAHEAEGLETATPADLSRIEIDPPGFGLHFPTLDADLYVPALLQGVFGSERWMAARLGARGGKSRTAAKAAASRKNGKLGGRPSASAIKSDGSRTIHGRDKHP